MLKLTFEGDNVAEVHQRITDYLSSIAEGGTPTKAASTTKLKKVEEEPADAEPEEKPVKKKTVAAGKVEEITDAELRAKIQTNEWPIEQAKAFMQKFGYPSVTAIPQKKRQEFVDLLEEASSWSGKKLNAYLEPEEL